MNELTVINPEITAAPSDAQAEAAITVIKKKKPKIDVDLEHQKALAVFGAWQAHKGNRPSDVQMGLSFQQMSDIEYCQFHSRKIMDDERVDPKTKLVAAAMMIQASETAIKWVHLQRDLVKDNGGGNQSDKPRNAPPVMDLAVSGDVHFHQNELPKTE
jgi:hypothetical protein